MPLRRIPNFGVVAFPEGMTEEEIQRAIAAQDYLRPGAIMAAAPPVRQQAEAEPVRQEESPGVLGWTGGLTKALARGAGAGVATGIEGVAQAGLAALAQPGARFVGPGAGLLGPLAGPIIPREQYQRASEWLTEQKNKAMAMLPQPGPQVAGSLAGGIAETIGAFAPMVGSAALGPAGIAAAIGMGAGMSASEQAERAQLAGADAGTQALAVQAGAALGAFQPQVFRPLRTLALSRFGQSIAERSPFLGRILNQTLDREAQGTLGMVRRMAETPLWRQLPRDFAQSVGIMGALSGAQEALAGTYEPGVTGADIAERALIGGLHGAVATTALGALPFMPGTTAWRRQMAQRQMADIQAARDALATRGAPMTFEQMGLSPEEYAFAAGNVRPPTPEEMTAAREAARPAPPPEPSPIVPPRPDIAPEPPPAMPRAPEPPPTAYPMPAPPRVMPRIEGTIGIPQIPRIMPPEPVWHVTPGGEAARQPGLRMLAEQPAPHFYATPGGRVGVRHMPEPLGLPPGVETPRFLGGPEGLIEAQRGLPAVLPRTAWPAGMPHLAMDPRVPVQPGQRLLPPADPNQPDFHVMPHGIVPVQRRDFRPLWDDQQIPPELMRMPIRPRELQAPEVPPETPLRPDTAPETPLDAPVPEAPPGVRTLEGLGEGLPAHFEVAPEIATPGAREGAAALSRAAYRFLKDFDLEDIPFAVVRRVGKTLHPDTAVTPEKARFFKLFADGDHALEQLLTDRTAMTQRLADVAEETAHVLQNLNILNRREWNTLESYSRRHGLLSPREEETYRRLYTEQGLPPREVSEAISREHQARVLREYLGRESELPGVEKANNFVRGMREMFRVSGLTEDDMAAADVFRKVATGEAGRFRQRRPEEPPAGGRPLAGQEAPVAPPAAEAIIPEAGRVDAAGILGRAPEPPGPDVLADVQPSRGMHAIHVDRTAADRIAETVAIAPDEPGVIGRVLGAWFDRRSIVPRGAQARYWGLNSREVHGWIDEQLFERSRANPAILAELGLSRPEDILDASVASMPAAMLSDVRQTIAAEVMRTGKPQYAGGRTVAAEDPNNFTSIVMDIGRHADTAQQVREIDKALTFAMAARSGGRAERLGAEGRERLFTEQDRALADQILTDNPWMQGTIDKIRGNMDNLLDYLVDTQVVERSWADRQKQYGDYMPFFREINDWMAGNDSMVAPPVARANVNVRGPKSLIGGDGRIMSIMETLPVAIQTAVASGTNNVAGLRAVRNLKQLGLASDAPQGGDNTVSVRVGGQRHSFAIQDPVIFNALKYTDTDLPEIVNVAKLASDALRFGVTRNPLFAIRNAWRDSQQAYSTSLEDIGYHIGPFRLPGKGAVDFITFRLGEDNPTMQSLRHAGVVTGYDMSGRNSIRRHWENYLKGEFPNLAENPAEQLAHGLKRYWDKYSDWIDRSDAVSRSEVYEAARRRGATEAHAEFEAREVLNFARHGASPVVRTLAAMVPFLNAKWQGMDVLYRAMRGKGHVHRLLAEGEAGQTAPFTRFINRALTFVGLAAAYNLGMHNYTAYKNATVEERDNNWLLPINPADPDTTMFRIPTAFDLGWFFKALPERVLNTLRGQDQAEDITRSARVFMGGQMGLNPVPQAVKPILESYFNYDMFRQRPIESPQMEDVLPQYRIDEYTSEVGRAVGQVTGQLSDDLGPKKIDHLIRGYFGTSATAGLDLIDILLSAAGAATARPAATVPRLPIAGRAFQDPLGAREIVEFNEDRARMRQLERTSQRLQRVGKQEDLTALHRKYDDLLPRIQSLRAADQAMRDMTAATTAIMMSDLSPVEKRDRLRTLRQRKIDVARRWNATKP